MLLGLLNFQPTSTSYVNVPNATVVITPTSATSRIVVHIALNNMMSSSTGSNAVVSMRREVTSDASDLYGDLHATYGMMMTSTVRCPAGSFFYDDMSTNDPGLVSLTYRLRAKIDSNTGTFGRASTLSSLLALEIEA